MYSGHLVPVPSDRYERYHGSAPRGTIRPLQRYHRSDILKLQSKINKALKINCPVTTFHKTGYAILRRQEEDRKLIVDGGFMFNVISNYLKGNILENPELVDKLILFFGQLL